MSPAYIQIQRLSENVSKYLTGNLQPPSFELKAIITDTPRFSTFILSEIYPPPPPSFSPTPLLQPCIFVHLNISKNSSLSGDLINLEFTCPPVQCPIFLYIYFPVLISNFTLMSQSYMDGTNYLISYFPSVSCHLSQYQSIIRHLII